MTLRPSVRPDSVFKNVEQPEPGGPKTSSISLGCTTPSKSRRISTRFMPRPVRWPKAAVVMLGMMLPVDSWYRAPTP